MSKSKNLEELFQQSFDGLEVKPSRQVWRSLERQLFWRQFFRFGFQSFNAYYAGAILAISVGSFFALSSPAETDTDGLLNTGSAQVQTASMPDSSPSHNDLALMAGQTDQPETDLYAEGNRESNPVSELSGSNVNHSDSKEKAGKGNRSGRLGPASVLQEEHDGSGLSELKTVQRHSGKGTSFNNPTDDGPETGFAPFHSSGQSDDPGQIPGQNQEIETVYDTVIIFHYDTIRVKVLDTVRTTLSPELKPAHFSRFSFELGLSPMISSSRYSSNGSVHPGILDILQRATTSSTSTSLEALVNVQYGNWVVQTGFAYTRLREDFDEKFMVSRIDSLSYLSYEPNGGYYDTDTTEWTFVYDQVGNAFVQVPVIEHYWNALYDTSVNWIYNTTITEKTLRSQNRYVYLEIPFSLGYVFEEGPFRIEPRIGGSLGFFSSVRGKTLSFEEDGGIIDLESGRQPFRKTLFSWRVGLGLNYRFNDRFSVTTEPFYRQTFQSIYEDSYPIAQKYRLTGLKVGFRYRF